jgi:hypothetical protein
MPIRYAHPYLHMPRDAVKLLDQRGPLGQRVADNRKTAPEYVELLWRRRGPNPFGAKRKNQSTAQTCTRFTQGYGFLVGFA